MNRNLFHQGIGRVEKVVDVPVEFLFLSHVTYNASSQTSHGAAGIEIGARGEKSFPKLAHPDRSRFRENDD